MDMEHEDRYWVHRSIEGDTEAFGRLVDRYQGAVYATAYYYAGRHGAAEDIAQDALLEAFRSLRSLNDPGRFGPWLKEVTCRTAANWVRRNSKRLRHETPLPHRRVQSIEDARIGPEEALKREERYERIRSALDTLPEQYRLPLIMRYLQEASYAEIAHFTGQTHGEIRGLLQRGTSMLRGVILDRSKREGEESTWHRAQE